MTAPTQAALVARSVTKAFGGTLALDGVGLIVRAGTIHALLGGNGSGKSTLIKCLAGVYRADGGEVSIAGRTLELADMSPPRARGAGLRFVHQDLGLFDELTVAENFALDSGFPIARGGRIRWAALHEHVTGVLADYDIDVRARDLVGSLRPSQKTMIAVARALADQVATEHVLMLDEPTATLPERESRELMRALRRRADRGQTIVLVSHRLGEVEQVADAVTVFRDGRVAAEHTGPGLRAAEISAMIAGGAFAGLSGGPRPSRPGEPVLVLDRLCAGGVREVSLTVRRGEIVGLAGLAGAGKSTLLRAVFGSRPVTGGTMRLAGRPHAPRSPRDAIAIGIGLVPEDRHAEGILADLTVRENASVPVLSRYWRRRLFMDRRGERLDTAALVTRHAVRTDGIETAVGKLSGGNQQKLVLAARTRRRPALLLLDEPTQGVDVMSRAEIYATLRDLTASGCGILAASTDLDELLVLCDRILLLSGGVVAGEFDPAVHSREEIVSAVLDDTDPTRD
ncbi:sugar ABC transporter ATP-binding protein [Actinomadura fibrosa]|uniref:Sugar ABC transporter ATP-binding protein n=1 Tax=Actinomadura fibrosa TaxID=111802 RepID=A0ABW2Y2R3_9ACTN|nr:sugar ABC transporter ATP-binding protein [Actinomadura fibrosa]